MLCRYCKSQNEFICDCSDKLCKNHSDIHDQINNMPTLNNIEKNDKLKLLSDELFKRITKIDKTCCEIIKKVKKL